LACSASKKPWIFVSFFYVNTCFWIHIFFLPGEPLLPKTPHVYVQSSASGKVFGSMQELTSVAELTAFFEEYKRRCIDGDIDNSRLRFENTMKMQLLLVTRRICSASNRVVYIWSLFDVAVDLWKPTPIQDNQQFIDLC
jgi:hypothetical protein